MVEFGIAEAAQSILVVFSSSSNGLVDEAREELLELVNQLAMLILPHQNVMTFLQKPFPPPSGVPPCQLRDSQSSCISWAWLDCQWLH